MKSLTVQHLSVGVGDRVVLRDISIEVGPGEVHALLGQNGSGKSSLAYALFGHPDYKVLSGTVHLGEEDILSLPPEERARRGLFLSFQEPPEIGGVSLNVFLTSIGKGIDNLREAAKDLRLEESFLSRFLHEGFSGGEKKKSEVLQFLSRDPLFAVFDEIDTGLDVDSVATIASILRKKVSEGTGILLITHSPKFLSLMLPDRIYTLSEGVSSYIGGAEKIPLFEKEGHQAFLTLSQV